MVVEKMDDAVICVTDSDEEDLRAVVASKDNFRSDGDDLK